MSTSPQIQQSALCSLPALSWEEGISEKFCYFWYRAYCQRDKSTACSRLRPTLILKSRMGGVLFVFVCCSKVFCCWFWFGFVSFFFFFWFHMTIFVDSVFISPGSGFFFVIEMVIPYNYNSNLNYNSIHLPTDKELDNKLWVSNRFVWQLQ